ncbi:hypothetical protein ACO22_07282 [Paracoccidioides brasiliensis]|uniref:Uncharacterized protein n=1 Tax=Paracoccidioides brasiliensis TaxID=121759 RepID=A0A1D2J524_PARBR|nr:hypothetical protein ACO22_07282 [Paracoccidioides brasiliensis]
MDFWLRGSSSKASQAHQALYLKKLGIGLGTAAGPVPSGLVPSGTAFTPSSRAQAQTSPKDNAGLQGLILPVPNIAIPAQSNTAATISPAVNVSLRDGASQRTNVIRNTESSNPRHISSECQPPIIKIHPTFAGAEDSVQKKR